MASKVDAAILALTVMWQAAMATTLAGVQVVDGPQANSDAASSWLFVGADGGTPTEDVEAAVAEQSWMAFAKTKQEDAEVTCAAVVVRGDTDIPAARASANAIVSAAEDLLRADLLLGGLVMKAHISAIRYIPSQTQAGAKVRIVFTVTYMAQL